MVLVGTLTMVSGTEPDDVASPAGYGAAEAILVRAAIEKKDVSRVNASNRRLMKICSASAAEDPLARHCLNASSADTAAVGAEAVHTAVEAAPEGAAAVEVAATAAATATSPAAAPPIDAVSLVSSLPNR